MEKSSRIISQVYGYAICLVAVITFLISVTAFFNAVIDRSDPIHSGFTPAGSPSLTSYENYKLDVLKSYQKAEPKTGEKAAFDEQTLKAMYEAARADKIATAQHITKKAMLISGIMIGLSLVLFFFHWRWMKRMGSQP